MPVGPVALVREAIAGYSPGTLCRISFAALALVAIGHGRAGADPTAQSILQKVDTRYNTATSYQGEITMTQRGVGRDGKPVTVTMVRKLRYKAPNMFIDESTQTMSTGQSQSIKVVCDGKSAYVVNAKSKKIAKQPIPPRISLKALLKWIPGPTTPGASVLPTTNVAGKAAYVIQFKPDASRLPPNMSALDRQRMAKLQQPVDVEVDKQNFEMLRVHNNGPTPRTIVQFSAQQFNAGIPSSTFAFTAPAGYSMVVQPTPPPPGAPAKPGGK